VAGPPEDRLFHFGPVVSIELISGKMRYMGYHSINTDIEHYRNIEGRPIDFWLRDGCVYLTPYDDASDKRYSNALKRIECGDVIFAYEGKFRRGYVAAGISLERWDEILYSDNLDLYGKSGEKFFRMRVDWNAEFSCSLDEIQAAGLDRRFGTINRIVDDRLIALLCDKLESVSSVTRRERIEEDRVAEILCDKSISETEKEQLVRARIGQGRFRSAVHKIESSCRLTHISDLAMLRASHIKPWRDSSNFERLDGNNGLLLAPHVDHLFDGGWITFDKSGRLVLSSRLPEGIMRKWNLPESADTGSFNEDQMKYLSYHRDRVFKE